MKNRKAQEMSIGAIVLIILAVIVLIVLIIGFTSGWGPFSSLLKSNNIEAVQTACLAACTTGSTYDFCTAERDIKDGTNDKFKANCNELVTSHPEYGITLCSSVTCPAS
jgi:hypothetical protein